MRKIKICIRFLLAAISICQEFAIFYFCDQIKGKKCNYSKILKTKFCNLEITKSNKNNRAGPTTSTGNVRWPFCFGNNNHIFKFRFQ